MVTAAVLKGVGEDVHVHDDIEIAPPGAGECKVKIVASGVCHSDLSVQNGTIPLPAADRARPRGRRHRRGGRRGRDVAAARRPRRALLRARTAAPATTATAARATSARRAPWRPPAACSTAPPASPSTAQPLRQMAMCGTFGNYAIVPEISLVKIDDDVDLRYAALIGCGVLTGVGAALNTANIRKGDTVAVVGCGGVGLNVIQGAKIAGAEKIIAVDMFESKLKMAEQFGATDLVKADEGDPVANVIGLTGGRGADVAFEVIGLGPTIEQTINMTRNGGEAILVGVPRMDVMLNLNAAFTFLYLAKTVKGCWYGSSQRPRGRPEADRALQGRQAQARGARLPRDRRRRRQRRLRRDAERRGRPLAHQPHALDDACTRGGPAPSGRSSVATGRRQPRGAHQPPLSPARGGREFVKRRRRACTDSRLTPELPGRERPERLRRAPGGHRRGLLGGSHEEGVPRAPPGLLLAGARTLGVRSRHGGPAARVPPAGRPAPGAAARGGPRGVRRARASTRRR